MTVGRFAVGDYFDGNSYAKDPRIDFMNWSMWASAAYDFPADLPGFTRGAVVELNRKDWTLRGGVFQVPSAPNSDILVFKTGGAVSNWKSATRSSISPANCGSAPSPTAATPATTATRWRSAPWSRRSTSTTSWPDSRRERTKYGFYVNGEQQVAEGCRRVRPR